ncbi:MAG: hypothetical protein ACOY5R_13240 [Pseudomonadota bacterium]
MRSEPGTLELIASAAMIVAMLGTAIPATASATTLRVELCSGGASRTIDLPMRKGDRSHDQGCTAACHAADPRRRRAAP